MFASVAMLHAGHNNVLSVANASNWFPGNEASMNLTVEQ
jgi:hypothetical protein